MPVPPERTQHVAAPLSGAARDLVITYPSYWSGPIAQSD